MASICRRTWRFGVALGALVTALAFNACGDDDGGEATERSIAGSGAAELFQADVFCGIRGAVEKAVGLLLTGGGSVPGAGGGRIVVDGGNFAFEGYSPDGDFTLDGSVVLDLAVVPATVTGGLTWRDAQGGGQIEVDMTVVPTTDPITFGGTLSFDGRSVDLAAVEMPTCSQP